MERIRTDRLLGLVRPRYGEASLIDVLPSVLAALGVPTPGALGVPAPDPLGLAERLAGVRKVAVLLVDGLGYHLIPQAGEVAPTLAEISAGRLGQMTRLTSGFPSTTPTSLAGLGTGAPPGAHGVVGFSVRVPGTGRVLNHIRWSTDPDPLTWQPIPTLFQRAAEAGVATCVVSRPEFEGSGLTAAVYRGAGYRSAVDVDALADMMIAALVEADGPALVYGYHPDLDHTGHVAGIDSDQWRDQARWVDRLITPLVARLPRDAALLVTADHGSWTYRRTTASTSTSTPGCVPAWRWWPANRACGTCTSPRVPSTTWWRPGAPCSATRPGWQPRSEAVAQGWFGALAPAHLPRIGDVVVVCRDRYVVVASETNRYEARLIGYHGSFTAVEMEIPLIVIRGGE